MSTYKLKLPLTILLLLLNVSCADAVENSNENEISWWQKTKEAITNMWSDSTQTVESLIKQSTETVFPEEKDALFAQVWNKVTPTLNKVLLLEKEQETLPDSAWFGRDQQETQSEINQLLDEAVAILSISHTAKTREHIHMLEQKIRDMKQQISQYRQEQVSAPIRSTWKMTVADYEEKIQQLTDLIKQSQTTITQLKIQFVQELSDKGLFLTQEQLDVLLSSVVGDDIIQSSIVYDNVKQISQQLMDLTVKSGEDIETSQRYYGMYTVLIKTLQYMQQTFINNIDEKYLPKINEITVNIEDLKTTTQNFLRSNLDENRSKHLLANLEAQNLTFKTAMLYKQHLIKQRRKIVIAIDKTEHDLQIAQNTYKTVRVSGELINLLHTSQKSFETLLKIQVPELLVFENKQMKQEFAILTQKLAE
jgi:gas vesicle protein